MRRHIWALRAAVVLIPAAIIAQAQPPAPSPPGAAQGQAPPQGRGPNFPQQQRKLADADVLARGKGLYEANCSACHGIDLRGGQQGGPNLLRSQTVLSDKAGELIEPIVRGGRPNPPAGAPPMPPFAFPSDDIRAIAEYLHSVLAKAGNQGRPPEGVVVTPEQILVGNASAGQAFFASRCATCHAIDTLRPVLSRAADPRELQNAWLSGGGGGGRGGRGGGTAKPAPVTVTTAAGARVEGRLVRIDDFTVSVAVDDGTRRTFVRHGTDPKIEIRDPAEAHRKLVPTLADKDMHDVTAYLWSLR